MLVDWRTPTSIVEADERRRILVAEIQEIEVQLGDRARRGNSDYHQWRRKAIWSLTYRLQELRLIREWKRNVLYEEAASARN